MLQLENRTPFKAAIAVLPDRLGIDTLFVIVKATLRLRPSLALAAEQAPPIMADEYHGDPATTSLKAVSDMHLGKPGTDVVLIGSAWAPAGRRVTSTQVSLTVADRRKTIRVSGDRVWRDGLPTSPQPFESMPLVWERAFGGWYRRGDRVMAEERNPVGCGFVGGRSAEEMNGLPLPNLEDPTSLLEKLEDATVPTCLAPTAPSWLPRRDFAGTYDDAWQRRRAPYLPDDFDPRYFNCAAPEFVFDRYLGVGERVDATGVLPDGPVSFTIPDARLAVTVTVAGSVENPPANLETISLEPDANRACLTWRASLACDRKALKVERILVRRADAEAAS